MPDRAGARGKLGAAIVGGGLMGLSCAIHCARSGMRTSLIEKGSCGSGQSAASGGQALSGFEMSAEQLEKRFGSEAAAGLFAFSQESREGLRRELKRAGSGIAGEGGGMVVALSDRQERRLAREARTIGAWGSKARMVSSEETKRKCAIPMAVAGLFDPEAFQIDPPAAIEALRGLAQDLGVELLDGRKAVSVRQGEVRLEGGERVSAEWVAVCAGLGADRLLTGPLASRAFPVLTAQGRAEGLEAIDEGVCAYDARAVMAYFRRGSDGAFLGGCDSQWRRGEPALRAALEREMAELFPGRPAKIGKAWQEAFDATATGLPSLSARGRLLSAHGLNGHGISLAYGLGREMARHMEGFGRFAELCGLLRSPLLPSLGPLTPLAASAALWALRRADRRNG